MHSPIRKHDRSRAGLSQQLCEVHRCPRLGVRRASLPIISPGAGHDTGAHPARNTELAKLTETPGRPADRLGPDRTARRSGAVDYDAVASFYESVSFLGQVFSGVVSHQAMPNVEILRSLNDTALLRAIHDSNHKDRARSADGDGPDGRCLPGASRSSRQ